MPANVPPKTGPLRAAGPALAGLLAGLLAMALIWLPGLPDRAGHVADDYAFFLPNLLAGYYWHLGNPWWALPWFNPALCGGFPLHADPQGLYLSLPQLLTLAVDPLEAVRISFLAFAAGGYAGAWWLARDGFRLARPAALLAALLFMLNGFYAVRMLVGHLGFQPFMLLPFLAACLVTPSRGWPGGVLRTGGFALGVAAMVHGGMAALGAPVALSLLMTLAFWVAVTDGGLRSPGLRLVGGGALGLAISASKLAGIMALMSHLPRDAYPLPGYSSAMRAATVALRSVFVSPWPDMQQMSGTPVRIMLHEFAYGVGPVPLLLLAAWLATRRGWPSRHRMLAGCALALLALVPVALNTYGPAWTPWLKSLPLLRNSSLLLRWFAAYILPAALAGAVALDRLGRRPGSKPWPLTVAGAAATLAVLVMTIGQGSGAVGSYDAAPIRAAWARAAAGEPVPPVTRIDVPRNPDGSVNTLSGARQDSLISGGSQMTCYQPLYGYNLESFPRGSLHPGPILDRTGLELNIKNPACTLYPDANTCHAGDPFRVDQADQALAFAAWHRFAWHKPLVARLADWTGILSFAATLAACASAAVRLRRPAA